MRSFQPKALLICSLLAFAFPVPPLVAQSAAPAAPAPKITDDPALDAGLAAARLRFLSARKWDRLSCTILLRDPDGSWRRGSYEGTRAEYPASVVKLAYLAAAMHYAEENKLPYDFLDDAIRPMIKNSDNAQTGVVVDRITAAPYAEEGDYQAWVEKRRYTEKYLDSLGLLGNQILFSKTYPSNTSQEPTGFEERARVEHGSNAMQPNLAAELMAAIVFKRISPGANAYMRELLTHPPYDVNSGFGWCLPPGSVVVNKYGVTSKVLNDVACIKLPNGRMFVLAAFSGGGSSTTGDPHPYYTAHLGTFADMVVEELKLADGGPPILRFDNKSPNFSTTGQWTIGSKDTDKYGEDYVYATAGQPATASWSLDVPEAGPYEVYLWWPDGTQRSAGTRVAIDHQGGKTELAVGQKLRGGHWVPLGNWTFEKGSGRVTIDAANSELGMVCADGLRIAKGPAMGATGFKEIAPGLPSANTSASITASPTVDRVNTLAVDPPPGTQFVVVHDEAGEPAFTTTGSWDISDSQGFHGSSYRYSTPSFDARAIWAANLPEAGNWSAEVAYRAGENRTWSAAFEYSAAGKSVETQVNQTIDDLTWVSIGTLAVDGPSSATVVLNAAASSGGDVAIADAVRFVKR